ncbi:NAD(P)-binding protein [Cryphonectria parasitica EP155]|uniref:NAD(P)-binding protein n=1 Tax=Cryphonectria parasitica (strain ATCC 38755 / EP155) TaxID=660469 RepID=A0A9P5CNN3_CRYP1|nr:NAD(P)-binding protein [Cryphonectria parasitica EP155]KAF3764105.1 NAD(P)-binding protein [Cryphonectria parasitica EP155]
MPTALIVGGHGKVAQLITKQLVATQDPAPYTVHSIIRNPDQVAEIEKLGAFPTVQDVEKATVPELLTTLSRVKPQVIIWAAGAPYGSTPDKIDAIDHEAAVKIFDALAIASGAGECGKRLISISALDIRDRGNKPVPSWYDKDDERRSDGLWKAIGPFMEAKYKADRELRTGNDKRGLEYTMVRPGGLSNDAGTGLVSAGKVHLGQMVTREDVATVVVSCTNIPETIGLAFDVVGGNEPISEAVKEAGHSRADTFEGYY